MPDGTLASVGRRVRKLRLGAGLSQSELAQGICTAAYASLLETGKRRPSNDVLERFAERLGTTTEYLLTGRSPELAARIKLDIDRARMCVIQGKAAEGLSRAERLRDESRRNGLTSHQGCAEEVVARALLRLGRRPAALEAFQRSIQLLRDDPIEARAASITGAARCRFQMGDVHHAIHDLESYQIDLSRRPVLDPTAALQVYGAMIGPYFEAGLMDKAREAADEVERLAARVTDPETLACSHINLAGIYLSEKRVEEAVAAMARAESLFVQIGAHADAAKAAINQAMVFTERERWEDARVRLKEALEVLADVPASIDRARALTQLGRVERLSGNAARAATHLKDALSVLDDQQHGERGLAQRELGLCALANGDLDSASRFLEQAIEAFRAASNPIQVGLTYLSLGDALGDEDTSQAAALYREGLSAATRGAI